MSGYTVMRVHTRAHAIIKALAGFDRKSMVDWLDELLVKEAERRGITLVQEEPETPLIFVDGPKEIVLPPKR